MSASSSSPSSSSSSPSPSQSPRGSHWGSYFPRIQWIELHDLDETPTRLRHMLTEGLYTLWHLLWTYDRLTPILTNALQRAKTDTVIDLCAGSGGPLPSIQLSARQKGIDFSVRLTDLVPAPKSWSRIIQESESRGLTPGKLGYVETSVDATACTELGFRTIFGSFHHFDPTLARKVISDAIATNQGIAIFEATQRSLLNVLFVFPILMPVLLFPILTPFIKPFSFLRLFLTYIIPVLPLMNAIDGTISCLRTYTPDEFRNIVNTIPGHENYDWECGYDYSPVSANLCYYIGIPKNPHIKPKPHADILKGGAVKRRQ